MHCKQIRANRISGTSRVNQLSTAVLAILLVLVVTCPAGAAQPAIKVPMTPPAITPPTGNTAFLLGHATGTQGYVCLPSGDGASWTVNRPGSDSMGQFSKAEAGHFW